MTKSYFTGLLLLVSAFFLNTDFLFAQNNQVPCITHSKTNELLAKSEDYRQAREELEEFTENYIKTKDQNKSGNVTRIIPVVIHIVHSWGSENIPDANVYDQMRILNEDFQKRNADTSAASPFFANIIGDLDVEFRLATIDPNGNCTNGINRIYDPVFTNAGQGTRPEIWPRGKYLNVWVVKDIASGAGAYTYLPGVQASIDGIVCRYTQFSSLAPSNDDRTLTHEIGHWFNLYHPWGTTNNSGLPSNCQDDDGVADTPNTVGASNCNLNQVSCGSLDNVQNYMDYAFCGMMFTQGQVNRMDAALNSSTGQRNNLWTTANLIATGTDDASFQNPPTCIPVAEFIANKTQECEGKTIQFFDESYNATFDSTWNFTWTFQGGTPGTSTDRNPIITYNTAGTFSVTLEVSNNAGTSNPRTRNSYITIEEGSGNYIAPITESFSRNEFPLNNNDASLSWSVIKPTNSTLYQWARTENAFYSPPASIYINNFAYNNQGNHELISPIADLSNISPDSAYINFQLAYARKGNEGELLELLASSDCGKTWNTLRFWAGPQIQTGASTSSSYLPSDTSEWSFYSQDISGLAGEPNVQFMFRWRANSGNNIYLDDISISNEPNPEPISSLSLFELSQFNVYPNPSENEIAIEFIAPNEDCKISITNIMGQYIYSINANNIKPGSNKIILSKTQLGIESGVYFINFENNSNFLSQKIIFN